MSGKKPWSKNCLIQKMYLPFCPSHYLTLLERLKMFLWRIGVNIIPTRENLMKRAKHYWLFLCALWVWSWNSHTHLLQMLGGQSHLAFGLLGFKAEEAIIHSTEDIIKLVINPPEHQCPNSESWIFSLNMIITMDCIWNLRNHVLFHGGPADILATVQQIHFRRAEFARLAARLPR